MSDEVIRQYLKDHLRLKIVETGDNWHSCTKLQLQLDGESISSVDLESFEDG